MAGRTAVVVQARMASTRLPAKVLRHLGGRSVLAHVLERCARIPGADVVCCAVPDGAESDPVAAEAERAGAAVSRGSEHDVLARYLGAARAVGAEVVLRVTSDCPLIDPAVCGEVLALRARQRTDYACNNMPPSWPHGLDCEAFTTAALAEAARQATASHEREHVTPWLRHAPGLGRANLDGPGGSAAEQRWTLDHPEDLAFLEAVFARLPDGGTDHRQVLALLEANPELAQINRHRADPARLASPAREAAHGHARP